MRRSTHLIVGALAAGALLAGQLAAWAGPAAATDGVVGATSRLRADASGALTVRTGSGGSIVFVGVPHGSSVDTPGVSPTTSVPAAADAVLQRYGAAFGADRAGTSFDRSSTRSVVTGEVVRYQQRVEGVPVVGGELVITLRQDRGLSSVLGRTSAETRVASASVSEGSATALARAAFLKQEGRGAGVRVIGQGRWLLDPTVIGGPTQVGARTVWRFEVTRGETARRQVMVDDRTGAVLMDTSMIEEANRIVCNDNDTARSTPPACVTATPPVRTEGGPAAGDTDVDLAYDYAGAVSDYYQQIAGIDLTAMIGRDIGGGTQALAQTVHFCYSGQCPDYANAFWNGAQMYYGNGFASADDVVGHEMTHGVTERTSNLFYWGQSGAMNESISDIMGEIVDHRFATPGDSPTNWRVGEALPAPYTGGLRDMADPTVFGDPDRTGSPNYVRQTGGYSDEDGVHSNSGVGNKTFYLISQGGSFNGQTITGIDTGDPNLTKSAKLWLLVDQTLSSGSDWADEADVLEQSCQALIGSGVTTAADCTAVHQATLATQLRTTPTNNPQPADADLACPAGTVLRTLFDSESGDPAAKFVAGTTWSRNGVPGWGQVAHTKPAAWGSSDPGTAGQSALVAASGIALPAAQPSYLWFEQWRLLEYDPAFYDGGTVEIDDVGDAAGPVDAASLPWVNGPSNPLATSLGNPAGGRLAFGGDSRGYLASRLDLSSYAGRTVKPRFTMNTDSTTSYLGWWVDDITVYTCDGSVAPPPPPPPPPGSTLPSAPTQVKVVGRLGSALITWQPPATNPAAVTGYRIATGQIGQTVGASARKVSLTGLPKGTQQFTVTPIAGTLVGPAATVTALGTVVKLKVSTSGGKTAFIGKLLAAGKGLAGKRVKVLVHEKNGRWVKVAKGRTGRGGKYSVRIAGVARRTYRVLFAGGVGLMGSQSAQRRS